MQSRTCNPSDVVFTVFEVAELAKALGVQLQAAWSDRDVFAALLTAAHGVQLRGAPPRRGDYPQDIDI